MGGQEVSMLTRPQEVHGDAVLGLVGEVVEASADHNIHLEHAGTGLPKVRRLAVRAGAPREEKENHR